MSGNELASPDALAEMEGELFRESMATALRRFEERLQSATDAEEPVGSDGRRLRRARRIGMEVESTFGTARITVVCGQCKTTGGL